MNHHGIPTQALEQSHYRMTENVKEKHNIAHGSGCWRLKLTMLFKIKSTALSVSMPDQSSKI